MSNSIQIQVHTSQFPEAVRGALLEGLRARRVPPKFLYQSYKQAWLWMALHRAHSPAWKEDGTAIYDRSFAAVADMFSERSVALIGLGCGGGYKEARLIGLLSKQNKDLSYAPSDVSLPLLISATQEAQEVCPNLRCQPLLCDLASADDLPEALILKPHSAQQRIITFFGMMPNFEPEQILPKLAGLMRTDDLLLLSANLSPGPDYRAGMQRVLPGYDNAETRAWLLAFLYDLGVEVEDGALNFSVEQKSGLFRFVADYRFKRQRPITVEGESFTFAPGESLRLFFSYRHTPDVLRTLLLGYQLEVIEQWVTASMEEGVFLCRRQPV